MITLEESWDKCMQMWRDIAYEEDGSLLKGYWVEKNEDNSDIALQVNEHSNCYFCSYDSQFPGYKGQRMRTKDDKHPACLHCPGYLLDKNFHCMRLEYSYDKESVQFLEKLEELHKVFLSNANPEQEDKNVSISPD